MQGSAFCRYENPSLVDNPFVFHYSIPRLEDNAAMIDKVQSCLIHVNFYTPEDARLGFVMN